LKVGDEVGRQTPSLAKGVATPGAMAFQVFGRASAAIGAQNLSLLIVMVALAAFITSQTSDVPDELIQTVFQGCGRNPTE